MHEGEEQTLINGEELSIHIEKQIFIFFLNFKRKEPKSHYSPKNFGDWKKQQSQISVHKKFFQFRKWKKKKNRKDSMHAQCTGEEVSILYYIIWYDMY